MSYTVCSAPPEHGAPVWCSIVFPNPTHLPSSFAHEPTATSAGVRPQQPGEEADLPLPSITSRAGQQSPSTCQTHHQRPPRLPPSGAISIQPSRPPLPAAHQRARLPATDASSICDHGSPSMLHASGEPPSSHRPPDAHAPFHPSAAQIQQAHHPAAPPTTAPPCLLRPSTDPSPIKSGQQTHLQQVHSSINPPTTPKSGISQQPWPTYTHLRSKPQFLPLCKHFKIKTAQK
ncbi:hypothetical protein ACLOJK_003978 [Asimina triloba]